MLYSFVAAGMDNSGKGGIIDNFSTVRRRLKENLAQKTGKEGVDNSEFEERAQRVAVLREKVAFSILSIDGFMFCVSSALPVRSGCCA